MSRIKISDLQKDQKISKEEMKKVVGGWKVEEGESIFSTTSLADPRPSPYTGIKSNFIIDSND